MIRRLLACLALAACAICCASAPNAEPFAQVLERHRRAMKPICEVFEAAPIRIEMLQGAAGDLNRISMHWQQGKFRQEYSWLGFVEVFGFDGHEKWYGSDMDLPYVLDNGGGLDVSAEFVSNFAYLEPGAEQYLGPAPDAPLKLSEQYLVLSYAPPAMSKVLLLLDKTNYRLAGMLLGSDREFADPAFYSLTLFEDWTDFGACWYPAAVRAKTLTLDGELVRERVLAVQSVARVAPLSDAMFRRESAPPVPMPVLPKVPYELPFSYLTDTVVIACNGPDGHKLRLELDTGASAGLLRRDCARRLGLKPIGDELVTGHGGNASVGYVRVEGVTLPGGLELPAWPAVVLSDSKGSASLEESLAGNAVAGLLGNFFLSHFVVQLDYRRRKVVLWPPAQFDAARDLGPGYVALPCHRDSMPYVDVTVDGKIQGGAYFNTGAHQFFTLSDWAVDRAGLKYDIERIGTGVTVKGLTVFGVIRPKQVQLGTMTIENPVTDLETLAPGEAPNPHRIASFGNEFFQRYKVTFDLYHEMYYIQKT